MKQGFDDWVRRLRSTEQAGKDTLTPLCGVEQRGNQKMEFIAQESGSPQQSDDEGRWQDDGGEGG
ncbi:MAG: hypothetical protein HY033_13365 [Ignavibacteriae bacterium]|nr:hypothetical protein [Ignavibacteriota bacterium]